MNRQFRGLENKRILVAEDVELNQFLAKEIMESWGCVVEIVENGLLALEKVSTGEFDLVLMDIQMPEMDGMSATAEIRRIGDARKASIPIIALTANSTERERQLYLSLGMNDCISKPFEERVLFEVVSKFINQHHVSGQTFSHLAATATPPSALPQAKAAQLHRDSRPGQGPGPLNKSTGGERPYGNTGSGSGRPVHENDPLAGGHSPQAEATAGLGGQGAGQAGSGGLEDELIRSAGQAEPPKRYDLAMVEAISGGDQSFVEKMLQLFIDTVPASLQAIRAAADSGRWLDLGRLAHKLKSTIDSMGITELKEDIRIIEVRGKSGGDMAGVDLLVNKVEEVMTDVVAQVRGDYGL